MVMNIMTKTYFQIVLNILPLRKTMGFNNFLKCKSYWNKQIISNAAPTIWEIETTNICPMSCTHCPRLYLFDRPPMHMPLNLFMKIIDQIKSYAQKIYHHVSKPVIQLMHYGEPSLYNQFFESIKYASSKGLYIVTSCTSSAIPKSKIYDMVNAALDEIWFIFDGMDDKTFQEIRGEAASFSKGMENLHLLINYKEKKRSLFPLINVVMIKHPKNRHQWGLFGEYFSAIKGINEYWLAHFSTFAGRVEAINQFWRALMDDKNEHQEIERVKKLNKYRCFYPWHSVSVLVDGRVVPCCRDINGDYVLGDLNHETLIEIWNGKKMQKLRQDFINNKYDNLLCNKCSEKSLEIGALISDGEENSIS